MNNSQYWILVVDDNADNRKLLETFLKFSEYQVRSAVDGQDALEIMQNGDVKFDVILLDRMMPRMNGLDLLKIIKKDPEFSHIPVIMQTAKTSDEEILEGIEAGSYYYLEKPYNPHTMMAIVKAAIQDLQRVRHLKQMVRQGPMFVGKIFSAHIQFQTMEEARNLAVALSQNYPDPESAVLGLTELLLNAVEHGNLGISYDEKTTLLNDDAWEDEISQRLGSEENKDKVVNVKFYNEIDAIKIQIEDCGDGFNWNNFIDIDVERLTDAHGRGIAMAKMISFTNIEYIGKGNKVIATVDL